MARAGLWYARSALSKTQVVLCKLPPPEFWDAAGFFVNEASFTYRAFGCEPGHIYIPAWIKLNRGQDRGSLRDVLRHEFGHALAYHHPGAVRRTRAFVGAFAARYDEAWPEPPGNREDFVTAYAMSSPDEDFAETFMVWLRGFANCEGGSRPRPLPPRRMTPALRAKFRFVRDVCRKVGG